MANESPQALRDRLNKFQGQTGAPNPTDLPQEEGLEEQDLSDYVMPAMGFRSFAKNIVRSVVEQGAKTAAKDAAVVGAETAATEVKQAAGKSFRDLLKQRNQDQSVSPNAAPSLDYNSMKPAPKIPDTIPAKLKYDRFNMPVEYTPSSKK